MARWSSRGRTRPQGYTISIRAKGRWSLSTPARSSTTTSSILASASSVPRLILPRTGCSMSPSSSWPTPPRPPPSSSTSSQLRTRWLTRLLLRALPSEPKLRLKLSNTNHPPGLRLVASHLPTPRPCHTASLLRSQHSSRGSRKRCGRPGFTIAPLSRTLFARSARSKRSRCPRASRPTRSETSTTTGTSATSRGTCTSAPPRTTGQSTSRSSPGSGTSIPMGSPSSTASCGSRSSSAATTLATRCSPTPSKA
mmetsp:Transcript_21743/g.42266  ORF Transcript_21743/g.42266 Transcript_21743/m.42266 type:complete len:253 (-) Transcript_21743:766-1524(-)